MTRINAATQLACGALVFLAPAFAQSGAWTSPVTLSTGGQGWEAAAAIDGNGNAVAIWDERTSLDRIWSRSKPSGGSWGSVTGVSPALETTSVFPAVRISAAGFATAVWSDQDGIWTADRPPASNWNSPQLLIPGAANPIFVMNSQGSTAIVWTVGGPPGATSTVMAVDRPAGGGWSAQQTVASGVYVMADHANIGENGAAIVIWESYTAICKKYGCSRSNFNLHASRQNAGTGVWVDSGSLLGPDSAPHDARAALDSAGAGILVVMNSSGAYASATQGNSGGVWSAFKTIVNPQGVTITGDLQSDDAGQVTLVYEFIGFSSSQALAVSGSIGSNTWSSPVVLSSGDTSIGQIYFALASNGEALAVWLVNTSTPFIQAVVRPTATGTWSAPVTISRQGSQIGPEAAAVNSSGKAVVIYSGYNAADVHTEYATSYQP